MNNPRASLLRVVCPHCGERATARNSVTITKLHREIVYQCSNAECGHSFRAVHEIIRTICPSRCPDPQVHLPVLETTLKRAALRAAGQRSAANDSYGQPANDDTVARRQSG